jgi:hypothetical protein
VYGWHVSGISLVVTSRGRSNYERIVRFHIPPRQKAHRRRTEAVHEEVSAWARQKLKDDPSFEPRVLGTESNRLGDGASTNDGAVIALNFIQAADFNEAVEIAKTHPGLRYGGVSIEVRPWRDPGPQAAPSP